MAEPPSNSPSATINVRGAAPAPSLEAPAEGEGARDALRRAETWNWPQTLLGTSAVPVAPSATLLRIAGYEVLEEIGRGGMGVVYKARQEGLDRVVALKMILGARFASPEQRMRFRLEGETAARVQHANIVQVHEVGTFDGQPFLVLEYVEGGTLSQRLREGPRMPPREAARLVEVLARAVHFAHTHGVVHRDLKPSNILLTEDATPKITDFGLAKDLDRQGLTETGRVLGTPEYMAPEQAAGRAHDIGPGVDVYALGAILYECLTGQPPFEADGTHDVMLQVLASDPVSPRRLNAKVPRDLETVALKCLQKAPGERYASAEALATDLRLYLEGRPIHARPAGALERTWKWARRRPLIAALAASLVLVTALGFGGVTWALVYALEGWREAAVERERAEQERVIAEAERAEAQRQQGIAVAQSRLARNAQNQEAIERGRADRERRQAVSHLALSRLTHALHEWRENNLATSGQLLGQVPAEGRGWVWRYLRGLHSSELWHFDLLPWAMVNGVAFSPDGRYLAAAGGNPFARLPHPSGVTIWDVATGQRVRALTGFRYTAAQVAYSPDGQRLAACSDGAVVLIWEAATGRLLGRHQGASAWYHDLAWSADGRRLAVACGTLGHVQLLDGQSARPLGRLHADDGEVRRVAYSPDGRFLASSANHLKIWSAATGELIHSYNLTAHGRLTFSPDSKQLAIAHENQVRIRNTATWAMLAAFSAPAGRILGLAFSPDGRSLVTASTDCTVRTWSARNGAPLGVWRGHKGRAHCVAFHPHGHLVASCSAQPAEVKVWDITRGQEHTVAAKETPSGWINALAFDDTSRRVIALRRLGNLEVHDVAGLPRGERPFPTSQAWRVPGVLATLSGGGRRLVAVTGEDGHRVGAWDTATGARLGGDQQHTLPVWHVASDAAGRLAASSAWGLDRTRPRQLVPASELAVWELDTGRTVFRLDSTYERTTAVALSPDGRLLARAYSSLGAAVTARKQLRLHYLGAAVEVWAVGPPAPREPLWRARCGQGEVYSLAFSARSDRLAAGARSGEVYLWSPRSGQAIHQAALPGPSGLDGLAFSPDGRLLAGVTRTQVAIWDVEEGLEVLTLRGAPPRYSDGGFSPRVAWSPDGRYLAATTWQHTVSIWDGTDFSSPAARQQMRLDARARLPRWHLHQARRATELRQTTAAAFHLAHAQRLGCPASEVAERQARLGNWGGAVAALWQAAW